MKLINLTPHSINLEDHGTIPPSGIIARKDAEESRYLKKDGIPLVVRTYQGLQGLPEPEPDTLYITSMVFALDAWNEGRYDVAYPGDLLRNEKGEVIGCKNICVHSSFDQQ